MTIKTAARVNRFNRCKGGLQRFIHLKPLTKNRFPRKTGSEHLQRSYHLDFLKQKNRCNRSPLKGGRTLQRFSPHLGARGDGGRLILGASKKGVRSLGQGLFRLPLGMTVFNLAPASKPDRRGGEIRAR